MRRKLRTDEEVLTEFHLLDNLKPGIFRREVYSSFDEESICKDQVNVEFVCSSPQRNHEKTNRKISKKNNP